jgi:hypothetical protein
MSAKAYSGDDRVMTEFQPVPNTPAISTASPTDLCLTKAVVSPKRHDPAANAAAREHGLALNDAALARLRAAAVDAIVFGVPSDDWLPVYL